MNTVGVRDTQNGVWIFWVIALPMTLGILVLTLLVAYNWERLKDLVEESRWLQK